MSKHKPHQALVLVVNTIVIMYQECLKARPVVKARAPPEQVVVVNTIVIMYQECFKARPVVKAQAPP